PPRSPIAYDVHPIDALGVGGIGAADHVGEHGMHEIVGGARKDAVRLEHGLARAQEALDSLAAHPIVIHLAEQPHSIESAEHLLGLAAVALVVLGEELLH